MTWLRAVGVVGVLFAVGSGGLIADAWVPFGKSADGDRLARMQASPQYGDGVFVNVEPMWNNMNPLDAMGRASEYGEPTRPVDVAAGDRSRFAEPPESGLRITWLGHSTQLIEIDGVTVLTDPIFGGRASPFDWAGPAPWYAPPIPLDEIPVPDAVLISHDHYDHLQVSTIQAMADWDTQFVVPLGVAAHLEYWGVPADRITELDWWEETTVTSAKGELTVACTPSRHASGRHLLDQMATLWASYALVGPDHRVYFSGDTGLHNGLKTIGETYGPFDLAMFEVGAYDKNWPDWHLGPENAITANEWVQGRVLMPIHWGMWNLALHGWTEPIERTLVEAASHDMAVVAPRPGESFEVEPLPELVRWWPDVPWQTAEQHPVVARGLD